MGRTSGGPTAFTLERVASTGQTGYALTAAGGNILTWTAPSDNHLHTVNFSGLMAVTTLEVGGQINCTLTIGGNAVTFKMINGALGVGNAFFNSNSPDLVTDPGSTVTLSQAALTSGAATLWATLYAD